MNAMFYDKQLFVINKVSTTCSNMSCKPLNTKIVNTLM